MIWALKLICLFGNFLKNATSTTNSRWQLLLVLIYLSLNLFFCPLITICHLEFVIKVLWKCYEYSISQNILVQNFGEVKFFFNWLKFLFKMFKFIFRVVKFFFLGWSTTHFNLKFLFFLRYKNYFFQVQGCDRTTLNYT